MTGVPTFVDGDGINYIKSAYNNTDYTATQKKSLLLTGTSVNVHLNE